MDTAEKGGNTYIQRRETALSKLEGRINACFDSAPATGKYTLLQLRQYVSGDALKAIES